MIVHDFEDMRYLDGQSNFLNNLFKAPQAPACNGIDSKTWTTRDAAISAVDSFCGQLVNLAGVPGAVNWVRYNAGTSNDVILTIAFPKDQKAGAVTISKTDCHNSFNAMIESCDGVSASVALSSPCSGCSVLIG